MIETLRRNLKTLRESRGLTQEDLSRECNYDKTYVGKIERGDTNPSFEALLRIADVLDVPSKQLFASTVPTDPREFEEQLKNPSNQMGKLFLDVFDNTPSISILTNPNGEILQLNQAAVKFLKAKANKIIGEQIPGLTIWSQVGVDSTVIEELLELGSIGRKATRRISAQYKGRELELQLQVSFADSERDSKKFIIFQIFSLEETVERTLIGDHFDLLKG